MFFDFYAVVGADSAVCCRMIMGVDDVLLRLLAFGRGVFFFGAGTVTPDMLTYDDVECHLCFFIDQRTNFETGRARFCGGPIVVKLSP